MAELVGPVVRDGLDRTLGQQRAQRQRHVGAREHLLHGDRRDPREAASAELGIERHRAVAGAHVLLVGELEALGRRDGEVRVPDAPDAVAVAVRRGDDVGHEPADLVEDAVHGVEVDVTEAFGLQQLRKTDDLVEDEADVA